MIEKKTYSSLRSYKLESKDLDGFELIVFTNTKLSSDFFNVYLYQGDKVDLEVGKIMETITTTDEGEEESSQQRPIAKIRRLNDKTCHCEFLHEPDNDHLNEVADMVRNLIALFDIFN